MKRMKRTWMMAALLPMLAAAPSMEAHAHVSDAAFPVADQGQGRKDKGDKADEDKKGKQDQGKQNGRDDRGDDKRDDGRPGRGGNVYPYSSLKIPPGHLPPPGECRIWFPNRPPGHQPPPQSCNSASREVPRGAWVITHRGDRYHVNMYNPSTAGVIDGVREYWLR